MKQLEWHPKGWDIFLGFYPQVWGLGLHVEAGPTEQEFQISFGPLSFSASRYI